MTDTELRIRVAELCGWKIPTITAGPNAGKKSPDFIYGPNGEQALLKHLDGNGYNSDKVPDYPNDLNAMQEAEKYLGDEHSEDGYRRWEAYNAYLAFLSEDSVFVCRATARQRCEAFVKTMEGK